MKIYRLALTSMRELKENSKLENAREMDEDRACAFRRKVWASVGYDVHLGFVVAADSEKRARAVAQAYVEQDPSDPLLKLPEPIKWTSPEAGWWTDPTKTTCEYFGEAADEVTESVVLGSFRAG